MENDFDIAVTSDLENQFFLDLERKYQARAAQEESENGENKEAESEEAFDFSSFEKADEDKDAYENKSILGKIGQSAVEVGSAPIRGAVNAAQELLDDVGYLAKWAAQAVSGDETDLEIEKLSETVASYTRLPNLPESESTAGRIADGVSQFIVGYVALGGFLRRVGLTALNSGAALPSLTKGAATSAIFFDGQDANIANLIQSVPELENPITEFLATSESDPEAYGKLKNALTDFGFGIPVEALARGIAGYAKTRRIRREEAEKAQAEELQKQADLRRIKELENRDQLRILLGDPDAPVFEIRSKQREKELAKVRDEVAPAPGYRYDYQARDDILDKQVMAEGVEPPKIITRVTIPDEIKKARPEFKVATGATGGAITARATFQTPEDKLAFIATAKSGKHRNKARELLQSAGYTDEQIDRLGKALREDLIEKAKSSRASTVKASAVGRRLFTEAVEETLGVPVDLAATALVKVRYSENSDIYFNFSRFYATEDVDSAIRQMQDAFERQPKVRSWLQANLEAKDVDAMATILNVSKDKLLSDSEAIALGQLFYASSLKLMQLADYTLRNNATEAIRYAFARHLETHRLISNRYRSSGTAVARSLASRRMPINPQNTDINQRLREIEKAIGTVQGVDNLDFIAKMVLQAKETGDIVALNKALNHPDGFWTKVNNLTREVFINSILSGVETLAVNVGAPSVIMMNQVVERILGGQIAKLTQDEMGMEVGEAAAFIYGMYKAIPEAIRYASKAFRQNMAEGDTGTGRAWQSTLSRSSVGDHSRKFTRAWSSEYLRGAGKNDWFGSALNVIGMAINAPMSFNIASDELWKTLAYRGELRALAFRTANKEVTSGRISKDQLVTRIAQILNDPPSEMIEAASKQAEYLTFTKDAGQLARTIQRASRRAGIGYMVLPFINTPTNIIKYSFSRTPFQLLGEKARARIAKGGYESQAELAKIGAGTLILTAGLDLYMNGLITGQGPLKKQERDHMYRQGISPYSIKIGDKYVQYNRLDPLGMLFGIIADAGDIIQHFDSSDNANLDTFYEIAAASSLAIAGSLANKTYFTGLSGLIEAVTDPQRYGESYMQRHFTAFMPLGGMLNSLRRVTDNDLREVANEWQAFKNRIPGLSEQLPPRRDLWGREITQDRGSSQTWNALMPIDVSTSKPEPIDLEMGKRGFYFDMPDKVFMHNGAKVDMRDRLDAYSRYLQLAGNEFIHPSYGLGAKDLLNQIVTGNHELSTYYETLSDGKNGGKHRFIRRIITQYRNLAKQQLLQEFPDLQNSVRSQSEYLEFN